MKRLKNKLKIYHKGISIFLTRYAPKKYKSGFTLIELMVVISIIGLLSSIVLVSIKGVREKAKVTKFKAEVSQFINALELYKTNNGVYPGEPLPSFTYFTSIDASGNIDAGFWPAGFFDLQIGLSKYISKIPVPPTKQADLKYSFEPNLMCQGDTKPSNYYILIASEQPGFENWPFYTHSGVLFTSYRCFSLR